jgi:hypothetical protein
MNAAGRKLVLLLRAVAILSALAVVPIFMPHAWMDAIHRRFGLGELPELPVICYLTRSVSALYAFHAGLLWLVSLDLRRHAAVITYVGAAFVCFGVLILGIDLMAKLPWYWIVGEGPIIVLIGAAMLALQSRWRQHEYILYAASN